MSDIDENELSYRIDGISEADARAVGGNVEAYARFPLEIRGELLWFRINGDTKVRAFKQFLIECRRYAIYGGIDVEAFLIVQDLPGSNRALRLKSNYDEKEKK